MPVTGFADLYRFRYICSHGSANIRRRLRRYGRHAGRSGENLPQDAAAERLGITRPRLNDLLRGKRAKFSLDALVNLATAADLTLEIRVSTAA
jgi:transcriptional regulator with XRE-family HTH domain